MTIAVDLGRKATKQTVYIATVSHWKDPFVLANTLCITLDNINNERELSWYLAQPL